MIVDSLLVAPYLDHGEMVRPRLLLIDVVAQVALILARRIGQGLERRNAVILLRRDDIDVRDGDQAGGGDRRSFLWTDCKPDIRPLIDRRHQMWLDLLAEGLHLRGCRVRIIRCLVLPDFDDGELVRWRAALK